MKIICNVKQYLVVFAAVFIWMLATAAHAALTMDNVYVTDVTPSSFSFIWQTSESAGPAVKIYSDSGETEELTNRFELTPFPLSGGDPAIVSEYNQDQHKIIFRTMVQNKGLIKVRVEGLQPESTYYCKLYSVGSSETIAWPETGLIPVTTSAETGFVAEDRQLIITVNQPDSAGWLVMAEHADTGYGVSSYLGDGAETGKAVLNLANLFTIGGSNWQPAAGEQDVVITVLGADGFSFSQSVAVSFSGHFTVAAITPHLIGFDSQAAIAMVEPGGKQYFQDESIPLSWEDTALQVNGSVSLYYDVDASGEDGTLIVSGLEEDPDGVGDMYSWNTTGVPDGRYYIYGMLTDGIVTVSSYAAGVVAIDRAGTDSDGDQMADAWENLFFDNLDRTGNDDLDNDGALDKDEFIVRTSPDVPDAKLQLIAGMNLVSLPLSISPSLTATDMLTALAPSLVSVSRIDPATQTVEKMSWNGGNPQGDNFIFVPGAGYTFTMAQDADKLFNGVAATDSVNLLSGKNLVGFVAPAPGYTAYQLLQAIGDATVVASIQRFNRSTGLFETAGYYNGTPIGTNFTITRGQGYIITMHQDVSGFVLP